MLPADNLLAYMFEAQPASASTDETMIGSYQISSWSASTEKYSGYNGYFILHTFRKLLKQKEQSYRGVELGSKRHDFANPIKPPNGKESYA